jgi:hypothetical protein
MPIFFVIIHLWEYVYLRDLQEEVRLIGDVRGLGLMIAAELVRNRKTKEPAHKETVDILDKAFKKGLLLLSAGELRRHWQRAARAMQRPQFSKPKIHPMRRKSAFVAHSGP